VSRHCEKGKHCTKLCKQEHGLQDTESNPALPSTGTAPAGTLVWRWASFSSRDAKHPERAQKKERRISRGLKHDQRGRTE